MLFGKTKMLAKKCIKLFLTLQTIYAIQLEEQAALHHAVRSQCQMFDLKKYLIT